MYKGKVLMFLALGLSISLAGLNGCASKKQMPEKPAPVKEVPAAPTRPAPPAVVPKAPVQEESAVPRDLSFATIYFDYDKSDIRSDQRDVLNRNAQLMSKYNTVRIRIEGHCDERGTEEYNIALGQRRADSISRYLTDYGISGSRISTVSYGEMRPVDTGNNESAWSKNRRGEIIITDR